VQQAAAARITYLDLVTLKRLAEAETRAEPTPPAFVDSMVRLSRCGLVRGDAERTVVLTALGQQFLKDHGETTTLPVS
jgi:hypothetical protein